MHYLITIFDKILFQIKNNETQEEMNHF